MTDSEAIPPWYVLADPDCDVCGGTGTCEQYEGWPTIRIDYYPCECVDEILTNVVQYFDAGDVMSS